MIWYCQATTWANADPVTGARSPFALMLILGALRIDYFLFFLWQNLSKIGTWVRNTFIVLCQIWLFILFIHAANLIRVYPNCLWSKAWKINYIPMAIIDVIFIHASGVWGMCLPFGLCKGTVEEFKEFFTHFLLVLCCVSYDSLSRLLRLHYSTDAASLWGRRGNRCNVVC